MAGAGAILAGVLFLIGKLALDVQTGTDPTAIIRSTPLWLLLLIVLFLAGVGAQWSIRSKPPPKPAPMATAPAVAQTPSAPPPSTEPAAAPAEAPAASPPPPETQPPHS
jgi:hypothetical protein